MKLYFFKQKALDILKNSIIDNYSKYENPDKWIDEFFDEKNRANYFFDSGIEVKDYQLELGGPKTDFQNSVIIFNALREHINPVQASDLRLWAYMAHVQHWDYMYSRWRVDVPDIEDEEDIENQSPIDKAISRIKSRYFFGTSRGKAYTRQGIARLYWGAYLTYDEKNSNPFEYTEYFFNKQDVFTSITERSFARNKTFILAALKELKKYPDLKRDEIRSYLSRLNQAGAITVLDYLNDDQASELCKRTMDEIQNIPRLKEGSQFRAIDISTISTHGIELDIKNGKIYAKGKVITTKPKKLNGKKEGDIFFISGEKYRISDIK